LVAAQTDAQRRQAVNQAGGAFAATVEDWRTRLIRLLAFAEAEIDFPDEDLPAASVLEARKDLAILTEELAAVLNDRHRGERIREGLRVAIIGPPNVGKSSLLNCLAKRDVAIVSDQPGTTRDVLEVHLDLGGYPVTLWDTAGLRETADGVEAEGVRRALARAEMADITLVLREVGHAPAGCAVPDRPDGKGRILLRTKCDVAAEPANDRPVPGEIAVSSRTNAGIEQLLECLVADIASRFGSAEPVVITRERHRQSLQRAVEALTRAQLAVSVELSAEDLRLAVRAMESVMGRVDVEQILDVVFKEFCNGK
jgi:tRNA modification GTPase